MMTKSPLSKGLPCNFDDQLLGTRKVCCYVSSRSETYVLYVDPTCLYSLAALGEIGSAGAKPSAKGIITAWPRCWTHLAYMF